MRLRQRCSFKVSCIRCSAALSAVMTPSVRAPPSVTTLSPSGVRAPAARSMEETAASLTCLAIGSSAGLGAKRWVEVRSGGKPATQGNSVSAAAPPQSTPVPRRLRMPSLL